MPNIKKRVSLVFTYESDVSAEGLRELFEYRKEDFAADLLTYRPGKPKIESVQVEEVTPPSPAHLFKTAISEYWESNEFWDASDDENLSKYVQFAEQFYGTK